MSRAHVKIFIGNYPFDWKIKKKNKETCASCHPSVAEETVKKEIWSKLGAYCSFFPFTSIDVKKHSQHLFVGGGKRWESIEAFRAMYFLLRSSLRAKEECASVGSKRIIIGATIINGLLYDPIYVSFRGTILDRRAWFILVSERLFSILNLSRYKW